MSDTNGTCHFPTAGPGFVITEGAEYLYQPDKPEGCQGHRYKVVKFVLDVPSYQEKVLVVAVTGVDAGLWFTVSPAHFASRYKPVEEARR